MKEIDIPVEELITYVGVSSLEGLPKIVGRADIKRFTDVVVKKILQEVSKDVE